jgi:hypothetical protein
MENNNDPFEVVPTINNVGIEQFKSTKIPHAHYDKCYERVRRLCTRDGASGVVILTGPTGAGKTHMARALFDELRNRYQSAMPLSPQAPSKAFDAFIPVVGLRANSPRGAGFDWQDFYIRLLNKLRDVLFDKKLLVPKQMSLFPEAPMPVAADSLKVCTLRRSVESALRNRRTRVVIIDEAHHILMCRDKEMQKYAFEQLKSLTDETGIILALVGTYDLLDIRDHSGQLMRRSEIIHLKRYCYNDLSQKTDFAKACRRIRKAMSVPLELQESEEANYVDTCQLKSAGAVGILVELHLEAQRRALEAGKEAVSLDLLAESAKPNTAILTILEEALRGEERLRTYP